MVPYGTILTICYQWGLVKCHIHAYFSSHFHAFCMLDLWLYSNFSSEALEKIGMQQNIIQTFSSAIAVWKWRLQTHLAPDSAIVRSIQPPPGNDQQEKWQTDFSLRQQVHTLDTFLRYILSQKHIVCFRTFLSRNAPNYMELGWVFKLQQHRRTQDTMIWLRSSW